LSDLLFKDVVVVKIGSDIFNWEIDEHTCDLGSKVISRDFLNILIDNLSDLSLVVRVSLVNSWDESRGLLNVLDVVRERTCGWHALRGSQAGHGDTTSKRRHSLHTKGSTHLLRHGSSLHHRLSHSWHRLLRHSHSHGWSSSHLSHSGCELAWCSWRSLHWGSSTWPLSLSLVIEDVVELWLH